LPYKYIHRLTKKDYCKWNQKQEDDRRHDKKKYEYCNNKSKKKKEEEEQRKNGVVDYSSIILIGFVWYQVP